VIVQISGMGMQNHRESCLSFQLFIISGKGHEDILDNCKQTIIDYPLVLPGNRSELSGQGECEKIIGRLDPFV